MSSFFSFLTLQSNISSPNTVHSQRLRRKLINYNIASICYISVNELLVLIDVATSIPLRTKHKSPSIRSSHPGCSKPWLCIIRAHWSRTGHPKKVRLRGPQSGKLSSRLFFMPSQTLKYATEVNFGCYQPPCSFVGLHESSLPSIPVVDFFSALLAILTLYMKSILQPLVRIQTSMIRPGMCGSKSRTDRSTRTIIPMERARS